MSKFTSAMRRLFQPDEIVRVRPRKQMVETADGQTWAFNGYETFYKLGTAEYRR